MHASTPFIFVRQTNVHSHPLHLLMISDDVHPHPYLLAARLHICMIAPFGSHLFLDRLNHWFLKSRHKGSIHERQFRKPRFHSFRKDSLYEPSNLLCPMHKRQPIRDDYYLSVRIGLPLNIVYKSRTICRSITQPCWSHVHTHEWYIEKIYIRNPVPRFQLFLNGG